MSNVRFCPKKSVIYLSALVEHVDWQTGSKRRTPKFSIDVCKVPWWCPLSYSSAMERWGLSESVHGLRSKRRKKTNITGSNHLHTIRRTLKPFLKICIWWIFGPDEVFCVWCFCHFFANMRICKQIGNWDFAQVPNLLTFLSYLVLSNFEFTFRTLQKWLFLTIKMPQDEKLLHSNYCHSFQNVLMN